MATLEEFFRSQFPYGKTDMEVTFSQAGAPLCKGTAREYLAFDEYVRFLGYYVAEEYCNVELLAIFIRQYEDSLCLLGEAVVMTMSHPSFDPVGTTSAELPFTGRIFLYAEAHLSEEDKAGLLALAASLGLKLQIRDRGYRDFMNSTEQPLGFISHDSRDKADLVEPLARKLRSVLCPVWYDDFSLRPGDSLRESIDNGLGNSKRCVVVLSPNFLSNPGWTKAEFNAAVNRHFSSGGNVLIPVWHGITRTEVADYSPLVVDIVAIRTEKGFDETFRELHRALIRE